MLVCEHCHTEIHFDRPGVSCECTHLHFALEEGVYKNFRLAKDKPDEMIARDNQASSYMQHSKFPTQVESFSRWLTTIPQAEKPSLVLDLGCGPGPTTLMSLKCGHTVLAVDFSLQSLQINRKSCADYSDKVTFIQEDLNQLYIRENSFDFVIMADFLQHLGGRKERERLLGQVFKALKPGGKFYLSFFNVNIINYLKGDIFGGFSEGKIQYERLRYPNLIRYFPVGIEIEKIHPMNIVHGSTLDKWLCSLPLAQYLSRMMVVQGSKQI